jgi:hypothetical protein
MKFEEHCLECIHILGSPYPEVHRWLDEFAGSPKYGMRHRKVRHHQEGIEQATALFGVEAGKAARLHIVTDLKMEGWKATDHFPQNERDYVKMGLY